MAVSHQASDDLVLADRAGPMARDLEAVMQFDHDWEPGENDTRGRRWVRRIAFVTGLVMLVWVVALISGDTESGENRDDGLPKPPSTDMPEEPIEAPEGNTTKTPERKNGG